MNDLKRERIYWMLTVYFLLCSLIPLYRLSIHPAVPTFSQGLFLAALVGSMPLTLAVNLCIAMLFGPTAKRRFWIVRPGSSQEAESGQTPEACFDLVTQRLTQLGFKYHEDPPGIQHNGRRISGLHYARCRCRVVLHAGPCNAWYALLRLAWYQKERRLCHRQEACFRWLLSGSSTVPVVLVQPASCPIAPLARRFISWAPVGIRSSIHNIPLVRSGLRIQLQPCSSILPV